ncbi:MAG: 50S ribosomal protein L35 [Legionellales bacterium]|nr:50S ribosomal protein L35 [Legionellales bacterium]|tara:strand:+ start:1659 stop:1856 length:198 start_codon:yes stop_codon:yes gene_type:complete
MSKAKTRKAASKRFKLKPNGDVKFRAANRGHILTKNTPKIKRQRRGMKILDASNVKSALRMLREI